MKKDKEPTPDVYRLRFKPGRWKTRAERFFSAFCAGEALDDFYYAFISGKVDAHCVTIYAIEMWDRFANKWICRQIEAIKQSQIKSPQMKLKGKCVYICNEEAG